MQKVVTCDYITKENIKEHNPDYPYKRLIIGGFESRKTNALLNLISYHPDTDKIYLCFKYLYEANTN